MGPEILVLHIIYSPIFHVGTFSIYFQQITKERNILGNTLQRTDTIRLFADREKTNNRNLCVTLLSQFLN